MNRELLLKDLCSRLSSGLICSIYRVDDAGIGWRCEKLSGYCCGDIWEEFYFGDDCGIGITDFSKIKPYLFPLSSMTEEQRREYDKIIYHSIELHHREYSDIVEIDLFEDLQEFYHTNHFDYRGLIERGLAIDCTNLNIY